MLPFDPRKLGLSDFGEIQRRIREEDPRSPSSRVRARVGDLTLTRYVTTGGSYLSQSELTMTFGVGEAATIDQLDVRWPNGRTQSVTSLVAGSLHLVDRSKGVVRSVPFHPADHN